MVRRRAFTLVELLVVITIIGILMSLLMPGLSSMRESGRRVQCQNNLKQIALAIQNHVTTFGCYPTGGWGGGWAGDPDRGEGMQQPGGWIYNILPFLDQQPLYEMGKVGKVPGAMTGADQQIKRAALCARAKIPLPIFNCPTRRRSAAFLFRANGSGGNGTRPANFDLPDHVARNDYAANGGSVFADATSVGWPQAGPAANSQLTDAALATKAATAETKSNGIVFVLSQISPAQVRDGASCTYLVGEKQVNPDYYTTGWDGGDNDHMYVGEDADICRWTQFTPAMDTTIERHNARGQPINTQLFGSAHAAGFQAALCDGSVRLIGYGIDAKLHAALGSRDGVGKINPATNQEELPVDLAQIP